jgi:hypothetical protein
MIPTNSPCDPVLHFRSIRLARQLVDVISGLLRPGEHAEAAREFYSLIRAELESEKCNGQKS